MFLALGSSAFSHSPTIARQGESFSDAVARWLAMEIFEGRRAEGSLIQGEGDSAREIGVSKGAWREGIHALVGKGMLQLRTNRGIEVANSANWNLLDSDLLEWMFDARPNKARVRALFELREICESGAVRLAALHRGPQQLNCLHRCLLQMENFGVRSPQGQQADFMFHRTIFAATGNEALLNLYRAVKASIKWTTHATLAVPVGPDPLPEHAAVYTAIHDRDALAASAAMQALLGRAMADMNFADADKPAP